MRNSGIEIIMTSTRHAAKIAMLALAIGFSSASAHAATVTVFTDPNNTFYGYETVYTNGLHATTPPPYVSLYLGSGGGGIGAAFPNDSTVDTSGNMTIQADDWPDVTSPYNTDTLIWADNSGTSPAICETVSDCYGETTAVHAGDTVNFIGTLVTNTLASPYGGNAVIFIKDFDSSWGFHGISTLNISTLTNGQQFSVTLPAVNGNSDFIQFGLEWSGPPVRSANASSYGMATISTNGVILAPPPPPTNVYVYLDPSQAWAGYRNVTDQFGGNYGPASGYIGVGGQTPYFQGSISSQGLVECAPDISLDVFFHTDLNIWSDTSGVSPAVATYDNTFYVDSTSTGARSGDTVVFSGTLVTNALTDAGMANSFVAFIKDFSSSWAYYGETTAPLSTLTNGQTFTITQVINSPGDHVQWGFEWQGSPMRTNPAAANYVGQYGYVIFSSNSVVNPGPQILSINPTTANVLLGGSVTFAANATGSGTLAYQWQKNGVNLSNGNGISGATSSTLTITNVQPSQEGHYNLIVTDSSSLSATNTVLLIVSNPSWLYYDRALAPFNGYINVWNGTNLISAPPSSGAAGTHPVASFGFGVTPTTLLRAFMDTNTDTITLQPNTYIYDGATNPVNSAYVNPNGSPAAYLEQDYFIQNDGLAGQTITFSGYCPSNSLNSNYTALAWIKDGSPDWSVEHRYDDRLVAGKPFKVTVASTAGDHIQYGFGLFGPDNSSTNSITQGAAVVKVYSPINAISRSGTNVSISFPTVINHNYSVQYKTNLTDSAWSTVTTSNGTGVNIVVTNGTSAAHRFYRLSTQ